VCSSWKHGVDSFLQNQDYHYDIGFTPKHKRESFYNLRGDKFYAPINPHWFIDVEQVEEFMAKSYSPGSNPFINRYVQYTEIFGGARRLRVGGVAALRVAFGNLLKSHGSHIWHAKLHFDVDPFRQGCMDGFDKRTVYNLVQAFFSCTPNLKTLCIDFRTGCTHLQLRETSATLERLLQSNPIPKLEKLVTLRMYGVPSPLEKGLLVSNNHVRSFGLDSRKGGSSFPEYFSQIEMTNLQEFVTVLSDKDENEKSLEILKSVSWPAVEALQINSEFVRLDSIFRALSASTFATNLKHLILGSRGKEDIFLEAKLELPHLSKLKLYVPFPVSIKNVDFLYPGCTGLSQLEISMNAEGPALSMTTRSMKKLEKEEEQNTLSIIQFVDYSNTASMLKSNIWTLLPELMVVKISWQVKYPLSMVENSRGRFKTEKHKFTRQQHQALRRNLASSS